MTLKKFILTLGLSLWLFSMGPVSARAAIYSWEDEGGVITYSDDPTSAPENASVKLWEGYAVPRSEVHSPDPLPQERGEPTQTATEGEFIVQLASELGWGEDLTAEEAASRLTAARVAPRFGRWALDEPMTAPLTLRLRSLTVAATQSGTISLTPEEALLAFDTTAALLGVAISIQTSPMSSPSGGQMVDTPPLVYLYPPPAPIYSSYAWVPAPAGFWYEETRFEGFFVLQDSRPYRFRHYHFDFDPVTLSRGFMEHRQGRNLRGGGPFRGRGSISGPLPHSERNARPPVASRSNIEIPHSVGRGRTFSSLPPISITPRHTPSRRSSSPPPIPVLASRVQSPVPPLSHSTSPGPPRLHNQSSEDKQAATSNLLRRPTQKPRG